MTITHLEKDSVCELFPTKTVCLCAHYTLKGEITCTLAYRDFTADMYLPLTFDLVRNANLYTEIEVMFVFKE